MKVLATISLIFCFYLSNAQRADSSLIEAIDKPINLRSNRRLESLILPTAAITYGFISLGNNGLRTLNNSTEIEIQEHNPGSVTKWDNYLQYSSAVAVYALNAFGIKGKHNFRDRTFIYALSTGISTAVVSPLKHFTKEERPDGSDSRSFPSGHTTTAFANAEFMRQEYKNVSAWYGVAGYAAATATGILRLYNNKHWVGDVVAGAGVGILSTKLAYLIYPAIKKNFFKDKPMHALAMPFYQNKAGGISIVYNINH
ncbi:MAG: phosphatase PAP2 family protein [Ferruginibacter sp.]